MFELEATEHARSALRALREDDPGFFSAVSARIRAIRSDPGDRGAGRAFLLEDGTTARLTTVRHPRSDGMFAIVWIVTVRSPTPCVRLIAASRIG